MKSIIKDALFQIVADDQNISSTIFILDKDAGSDNEADATAFLNLRMSSSRLKGSVLKSKPFKR